MNKESPIKILFVCMGNICRSPTAEGVFRKLVADAGLAEQILIDSAGTHAYHVNEPADRRAAEAAGRRGFNLGGIRARRVGAEDFERFDLLLAMDNDNLRILQEHAPEAHHNKLRLFLSYTESSETEVPDPYYGGAAGFERVLDLVEAAARGLLNEVTHELQRHSSR
ncbi:MAG: low molecular weight protein-tyrosine-phosphatase [Woeseia sp.]